MKIVIGEEKKPMAIAMGGMDSHGNQYGVNSRYLTRNNSPILPIMGEFHF